MVGGEIEIEVELRTFFDFFFFSFSIAAADGVVNGRCVFFFFFSLTDKTPTAVCELCVSAITGKSDGTRIFLS